MGPRQEIQIAHKTNTIGKTAQIACRHRARCHTADNASCGRKTCLSNAFCGTTATSMPATAMPATAIPATAIPVTAMPATVQQYPQQQYLLQQYSCYSTAILATAITATAIPVTAITVTAIPATAEKTDNPHLCGQAEWWLPEKPTPAWCGNQSPNLPYSKGVGSTVVAHLNWWTS